MKIETPFGKPAAHRVLADFAERQLLEPAHRQSNGGGQRS
jgi:hypothetical protein